MLISKEGCRGKPHQYRLITCSNTMFKLMMAIVSNVLYYHAMEVRAIPAEQRALVKEKRGSIDALHLDNKIASDAKHCKENLSVAWIDYQKAFDRVSHLWIHCLLKAIKAPRAICRLLK